MSRARPLVVLSIAGLSRGLLRTGGCPNLEAFAHGRTCVPVRPVLPALTLSMQATFLTGEGPGAHGVVGNGFFDRTLLEHRFWTASANLLDAPPFWKTTEGSRFRTAALFWWCCMGGGLDAYLNVQPIHRGDGRTVSSCYSDPPELYPKLEKKLGPFPLHRFWGPMVSLESSRWILAATLHVAESLEPDIVLSYIPHMDYSLQRSGPDSEEARRHLQELDALLAPALERAGEGDLELVILSEYGITPVRRAVSPNRALLREGLFRVRTVEGMDYPDLPGSRAFALCDHQAAHLHVRDPEDLPKVAALVQGLEGVQWVLDREGKAREGLDHPRSGELVAVAEPDAWFAYPWWEDESRAPDYAFTVDIHRKIGYDPLELVIDPHAKRIASDPGLIRGSHGAVPEALDDLPVLVIPLSKKDMKSTSPLPAIRVKDVVLNLLAGKNKGG